ncbi:MAG TPA: fumarylacetoacetate hydrolase family protein [Paraburkholderia sp.]|jgi:2-keto-4-pentenoate hydratase|nr:fumarylacetoacetate hydrolase family protein [Paraburkholderia sp.]
MSEIDLNAARRIADTLWEAQQNDAPIEPVRDAIAALGGDALQAAYAVQRLNTERRVAAGRRLVGRKIGLTSKAVQTQLGVDQPDFGMLFDDMSVADGEEIAMSRTQQPKVEAEIALVLARDLPHERHTLADLIGATAYVLPAIEIVGSRIAKWDIRLTDTVADNASSGLFVLGNRPVKLDAFDAIQCGMVMERRGDQVSIGVGAACLGNPLHAALWLANTMTRVGAPLKAGDIVLTGALGPMVSVHAGDVFTAYIEGLGSVSASFAHHSDSAS